MTSLVVIGGGRMGEALLGGLLAAGRDPGELGVVEADAARRDHLRDRLDGVSVAESLESLGAVEGVVLAVKPHQITELCASLGSPPPARVLSIAAGVPLSQLEGAVPSGVAVVRAMPNTPSLVGAGVAAICGGSSADDDALAWAEDILAAVGTVVRVDESQIDTVTGLSGSGPAYLFLVAEALIEGAVLDGLPRDVAERLVSATIAGAGQLLAVGGGSAAQRRAEVTSPGGTTAAGLRVLERAGVRAAFADAVVAAAARSRELAR